MPSVARPAAAPVAAAGRRHGAASSERSEREGGGPEGMGPKEVEWRLRSPFPSPADGARGFPPRAGSRKPKRAERAREPEGDRRKWGGGSEVMGSRRVTHERAKRASVARAWCWLRLVVGMWDGDRREWGAHERAKRASVSRVCVRMFRAHAHGGFLSTSAL